MVMNELALFAGAGGGILGGHLLGWRTVCAVEWEAYPASVLCARQNDGLLPPFPIWDDVQTFDGHPWRGIVDVVSGGFPCQDISSAGGGGEGITGARSSMWKHMARIIGEVRPQYAFVENSPMLTTRGLGVVLADLSTMGFDAKWGVVSAADVGANHQRERIWIVAHANSIWRRRWNELEQSKGDTSRESISISSKDVVGQMANTSSQRSEAGITNPQGREERQSDKFNDSGIGNRNWWAIEPNVGRVVDGVAARVDRLKAIGNGQVPLCAATAWELLK